MQVNTDTLLQIIGQKEVELAVLRQQVQELQQQVHQHQPGHHNGDDDPGERVSK